MFERLFDYLLVIIKAFKFFDVVDVYQRGVVLRLGKPHREVGPGLVWLIPLYVDKLLVENVVLETLPVGPQSLTTLDGKNLVLSTVVSFTIEDVRKFLLEVEGRNEFIEDTTYGIQSKFVMSRTWQQLLDIDVENELTKAVRRRAKDWGINIHRVQVADFSLSRSLRLIQPVNRTVKIPPQN
jgi:regulator of protease activity HflC (stomatin/prohibitin superfamily)